MLFPTRTHPGILPKTVLLPREQVLKCLRQQGTFAPQATKDILGTIQLCSTERLWAGSYTTQRCRQWILVLVWIASWCPQTKYLHLTSWASSYHRSWIPDASIPRIEQRVCFSLGSSLKSHTISFWQDVTLSVIVKANPVLWNGQGFVVQTSQAQHSTQKYYGINCEEPKIWHDPTFRAQSPSFHK